MSWTGYIILGFVIASIFFLAAAYALHWAQKNGQLQDFDRGARVIFDDDEPEGETTDAFPPKKRAPRR